MSAIKGKNTKPELAVRSVLKTLQVEHQLHSINLPGKPDIVLPQRKKIIFVHGCFWHVHHCRYGSVIPATNPRFWKVKRQGTRDRDKKNRLALRKAGWKVFTVWECWTKKPAKLAASISKFLARK